MAKKAIFGILAAVAVLGLLIFFLTRKEEAPEVLTPFMKIESPAFQHNASIPKDYTCDGRDVNPPLTLSDVPAGAKSLALVMDDPDAPRGTWVHWTIWNIDPRTIEILENSVPEGAVEGMTSFRTTGYGGPCPPSGTHRYFFKLYALDTLIGISRESEKASLERAMEGHILAQAELVGLYNRQK